MSKLIGNQEFDGDVYVKGLGEYDGTNPSVSDSLKEVVDSKYDKPSSGIPSSDLAQGVQDSLVFEKGSGVNSVQEKGLENSAFSETSIAIGKNNVAGLKGFYYKHIQKVGNAGTTVNIFLSTTQVIPTMNSSAVVKDTSIQPSEYWEKGDIISIINDSKYYNLLKVTNFLSNGGGIQATWIGSAPFNSISSVSTLSKEDYSIFCISKSQAGISDLVESCIAIGTENKSVGGNSVATGHKNEAYGKFSFVEGRENKAGYAAHAEGQDTQANGTRSHAEGYDTVANGNGSHAEGQHTETIGQASHAEGYYTTAGGIAEHAEGLWNVSNTGSTLAEKTIHSIGIGSSSNRKNAFEVMQNGDTYVYGFGGYDGTNPTQATPINTILSGVTKIVVLTQQEYDALTTKDINTLYFTK